MLYLLYLLCTMLYTTLYLWRRGVVVITTAQLHSVKPELTFCTGLDLAHGLSLVNHTTKTIHHHHVILFPLPSRYAFSITHSVRCFKLKIINFQDFSFAVNLTGSKALNVSSPVRKVSDGVGNSFILTDLVIIYTCFGSSQPPVS